MDPGIKDILDLPLLDDDDDDDQDELCAVSVLAAVVDYANTMIRRAAETFAAPRPAAASAQSYTPLELRVVPVDGVRQFADPDFGDELSTAQRE